jgi:imidazolonepropionase-like amidohydrolase
MSANDPAEEYALMAESGMTRRQILASLTTAPAERFEQTRAAGRIAPGAAADLTILGVDPMTDVRGFTSVRYAVRRGRILYARF